MDFDFSLVIEVDLDFVWLWKMTCFYSMNRKLTRFLRPGNKKI